MRGTLMLVVGVGTLALLGTLAVGPAPAGASDLDGEALFTETHKCSMCHGVPAAGIEAKTTSDKMKGPDIEGPVEVELEQLASYLRKQGEMEGKEAHKKEFKGTDEELQAILDWLGSLEASE